MSWDVVLPAFEMDCRDWLVGTPTTDGLPEEVGGRRWQCWRRLCSTKRPFSRRAVFTIGWPMTSHVNASGWRAELLDPDGQVDDEPDGSSMRYVVPSPDGQLGLLAEFTLWDRPDIEILSRVEALMASFRWAL
jgi:hypothetical protein